MGRKENVATDTVTVFQRDTMETLITFVADMKMQGGEGRVDNETGMEFANS